MLQCCAVDVMHGSGLWCLRIVCTGCCGCPSPAAGTEPYSLACRCRSCHSLLRSAARCWRSSCSACKYAFDIMHLPACGPMPSLMVRTGFQSSSPAGPTAQTHSSRIVRAGAAADRRLQGDASCGAVADTGRRRRLDSFGRARGSARVCRPDEAVTAVRLLLKPPAIWAGRMSCHAAATVWRAAVACGIVATYATSAAQISERCRSKSSSCLHRQRTLVFSFISELHCRKRV